MTWTVRCYNDAGYDETITTTATSAVFTGLDHTTGYTVKVTAEGMTQSVSTTVTADPITVTGFSADSSAAGELALSWEFTGSASQQGWELSYTVDGATAQTVTCTDAAATVPLYPGSHYTFTLRPLGEITYFCDPFAYDAPEAEAFEGYLVTGADMNFSMCAKPDTEHWDRYSLTDSDYRTVFAPGESAAFLVRMMKQYNTSEDMINTTYIIRDAQGNPVSLDTQSRSWGDMWDGGYCQLEIPQMPTVTGTYSIEIYFNGFFVTTLRFAIQ